MNRSLVSEAKLRETADKGGKLEAAFSHEGWSEVLEPLIDKTIKEYQDALTNAILSNEPLVAVDPATGYETSSTPQIIAARIEGLKWTKEVITEVIGKGRKAIETLQSGRK